MQCFRPPASLITRLYRCARVASILVNFISTKQLHVLGMVNQSQSLQECKLMALHQMVQRFAEIVDRVTWVTPEAPQDDDAVNAVAMLYHNKAHGKCMHAYMHLQIRLFVCSLFCISFVHPSIHSSIHPLIHLFKHSSHVFVYGRVCTAVGYC